MAARVPAFLWDFAGSSRRLKVAVEIGKISLERLTCITVNEVARIVPHAVPGLAGDLAQTLGRPSVEVNLDGIFFEAAADDAAGGLDALRQLYLAQKPVDFFADAVGQGYFTQVLISSLHVTQQAGETDQFNFSCKLVEYVEPPEPKAADPFGALDAGLVDEASSFMDDVQNAADQVSKLAELAAGIPDFGNPTTKVTKIPGAFTDVAGGSAVQTLTSLRELF
jgi:hypothetical protein